MILGITAYVGELIRSRVGGVWELIGDYPVLIVVYGRAEARLGLLLAVLYYWRLRGIGVSLTELLKAYAG